MSSTFKTNPVRLGELLEHCAIGRIQLPDFQRGWVWDEDRIRGLIASVSQAFPMGALMTLEVKPGAADIFARRPIEGAAATHQPDQLLLDGQQRMTSLFQTCVRKEVVRTQTARNKVVERFFYIDIRAALDPGRDREDAIIAVPANRRITTNFGREVVLDLSTPADEYRNLMFPVNQILDGWSWASGFLSFPGCDQAMREAFDAFRTRILETFRNYHVPVIALAPETSHAAVCLVFEKVNTGGKALDAFELVTAMYASSGVRLRDEWLGTTADPGGMRARLQAFGHAAGQTAGVLEKVAGTDMLQAISLLHGVTVRAEERAAGVPEERLTAIRATHQALLDLPVAAYRQHRAAIEEGFKRAARLLRRLHIFRAADLPYQTQITPLAAILAHIPAHAWESEQTRAKLARWYWCGVFGELYGSAVESRFAKDVVEVPAWIAGGEEPSTVKEGVFRVERLRAMRTRLSAAYKGVHALLMAEGARDWRTGDTFLDTVFFDEAVDIHHIFPKAWCAKHGKRWQDYDSIINKTPLGAKTNRILGGDAPSAYLPRLGAGAAKVEGGTLDGLLASHLLDPALLRADEYDGFLVDRERRLLALIARATGHRVESDPTAEEGEEGDEETLTAPLAAAAE